MIEGVLKTPLNQIQDDRGKVMHMLRATDPFFQRFGEVYFSWIYPNVIKAWRKHLEASMNYTVPVGTIKLVLYDDRPQSSTVGEINEFIMNTQNYYLLTIPNNVWYGFEALENQSAMIVNCSTIPHNLQESMSLDFNSAQIPYSWGVNND